jgi:hypothetical protein
MVRRSHLVPSVLIVMLAIGCRFTPSPEDLAKIKDLQAELATLRGEIGAAEQKTAALTGGMVKALVDVRLEVLKTNAALLQQRIHALESGGRITTSVTGGEPDAKLAESLEREIRTQQEQLKTARQEAAQYSGGLVGAMKQMTVATQEQTLAMLSSRYLSAKYGLPTFGAPNVAPTPEPAGVVTPKPVAGDAPANPARTMITVKLLRKRYAEQDYQNYVWFDLEITGARLDKPTRAIKGKLHLQDLFGEPKLSLNWSIDEPLAPGATVVEKGTGFKFNQFMSEHQWVRTTELPNMTAGFTVESILYQDGTRTDF